MSFEVDVVRRIGEAEIRLAFSSGPGLTALFGPSGCGKTSVLNMVAGLLRPDRGRIVVAGETLFGDGIDVPPETRRAGYVFQDRRLFPHLSVRANLAYGRREEAALMGLDEAATFLGIGHLLDRRPASLSGGEAQRVAIGRALLSGPRFLLMDEPLVALDRARADEIMVVIERIRDEVGLPILYVSHNPAEVARLATHVVEVSR
ncbi:ATP-binding cassette domain-containing protein [Sphingomonas sp. BIUV-7]|uniref:ATP-binding cassette domain-containing protein n=1 Tax=Sphingomonas natans TaxID=3063330 RepID=A0ABT8Y708_9SPHN|nr:ATP-binding cassette domain-containing protein [Sphingomonas sp. BIUV-7]MDO6413519.1 ATP-binding cassette domain-containing protein [Sphingomonas sp. BIUV-7]